MIVIYNNFFLAQREQEGIILLSKTIILTTQAQRLDTIDLTGGIKNKKGY